MAQQPQLPIALVTGATGFVGSHLVQKLIAENWTVHAIVRSHSQLHQIEPFLTKMTLHVHDGTSENLLDIVKTVKPAVVFHLASLVLVEHSIRDIIPLLQSNLIFATQLVEAMVARQCYCLINTGTFWQHYNNKEYSPVCLYAATKQAFEVILQFYLETTPLKVVTLKLFDTYGPNDPRPKLFNLLKKATQNQETLALSPGEQLIDLVYINDVVEAYFIAAKQLQYQPDSTHQYYAVSSHNPISLKQVVSIYEQETNTQLPIQWGGKNYRQREVMIPWNQGKWLPGWQPTIDIRQGIKKSYR
jgi:nucleoside-diphosphate-sugar epimerase